ncbi:fluoride efflux transporter CrcB [Psychrobacillus sp. PGGUH221]|uniref:fluoride efflux transporter CrcB n=1 Tax=Psychrobacillus sp. PGGUH221 TaxID=3020058 RepID=UPI0035C6657B
MAYLLVGVAGALGALLRYLIGLILFTDSIFPFATLAVNLVGCYFLAYLTTSLLPKSNLSSNLQTAITTGFLGAFTTFSTFSLETVELVHRGEYLLSIVYVLISMIGGILMSKLGWKSEGSK